MFKQDIVRRIPLLALCAILGACTSLSETQAQSPSSPLIEGARWHHLHINSTNPEASAAYYERHFNAEVSAFPGADAAVKAQNAWLLFTKVDEVPSTALNSPIWHIGWGAPVPQSAYEKQQALGAEFVQPITDIHGSIPRIAPGRFFYMYLRSPDGTLIELNTARTDDFGHVHMFSAEPITAGDWYIRYFGVEGRPLSTSETSRAPVIAPTGLQNGPSSSHQFDQVNMIIYPVEYSQTAFRKDWRETDELVSPRGNVNDHIGIEVPDLDAALLTFKQTGVTVLEPASDLAPGIRHAFVEGPDKIAIELLELAS